VDMKLGLDTNCDFLQNLVGREQKLRTGR
jgi:hypothetical protein